MSGTPKKTIYEYTPEFRTIRLDYEDGRPKKIRPEHMSKGSWVIGDPLKPLPLYRTFELDESGPVIVAEGPKCAEKFREYGFQATTSSHGTGSARHSDWSLLAGRDVAISPDNDGPGKKYRDAIAEILTSLDPPASVKIINLGGLPPGGDIVDYCERLENDGKDKSEIIKVISRHIRHARPWVPANRAVESPSKGLGRNNKLYKIAAKLRRQGLDRTEIAERLHDKNLHEFDPPLSRSEVDGVVKSAMKSKSGKRPSMPAEFKPFPVRCLPDVFQRYTVDEATSVGCDPSFIALPLLASAAAAIGATAQLQVKPGWNESAILWTAIVGDSGSSKTPALSKATAWTQRHEAASRSEHDRLIKDYTAQLKAKDGQDDTDELKRPTLRRYICADITVEALASLLKSNPRGILVRRDELAGWLASFDRYAASSGGDVAAWLELHSGHPSTVDRKTGDERATYIPRSAVSVTGGIQPGPLRRALGTRNVDNGLAARFLFAYPPSKPKRWTDHAVQPAALNEVADVFDKLFALPLDKDEHGQPVPATITFSKSGKDAFIDFFNSHNLKASAQTEPMKAVFSKLEAYAARLALIMHMTRVVSDDTTLKFKSKVDGDSVAAAVELARWFAFEAQRVYQVLAEDEEATERRRLIEALRRMGGKATADQLRRKTRQFKTSKEAAAAFDELSDAGLGRWAEQPSSKQGGRPTRRFELAGECETEELDFGYSSAPGELTVAQAWREGMRLSMEAGLWDESVPLGLSSSKGKKRSKKLVKKPSKAIRKKAKTRHNASEKATRTRARGSNS